MDLQLDQKPRYTEVTTMKILLVSPLYPPDTGLFANYSKELAKRLSLKDKVTLLTYGDHPEQIANIRITSVSKQKPLFARLLSFMFALRKLIKETDVVFIQNGASVELPLIIASMYIGKPIIARIGDTDSLMYDSGKFFRRILLKIFLSRAVIVISDSPETHDILNRVTSKEKIKSLASPNIRPKILPFETYPTDRLSQYENSWKVYIKYLEDLFSQYAKSS